MNVHKFLYRIIQYKISHKYKQKTTFEMQKFWHFSHFFKKNGIFWYLVKNGQKTIKTRVSVKNFCVIEFSISKSTILCQKSKIDGVRFFLFLRVDDPYKTRDGPYSKPTFFGLWSAPNRVKSQNNGCIWVFLGGKSILSIAESWKWVPRKTWKIATFLGPGRGPLSKNSSISPKWARIRLFTSYKGSSMRGIDCHRYLSLYPGVFAHKKPVFYLK